MSDTHWPSGYNMPAWATENDRHMHFDVEGDEYPAYDDCDCEGLAPLSPAEARALGAVLPVAAVIAAMGRGKP